MSAKTTAPFVRAFTERLALAEAAAANADVARRVAEAQAATYTEATAAAPDGAALVDADRALAEGVGRPIADAIREASIANVAASRPAEFRIVTDGRTGKPVGIEPGRARR